jgi:hypothetical protein
MANPAALIFGGPISRVYLVMLVQRLQRRALVLLLITSSPTCLKTSYSNFLLWAILALCSINSVKDLEAWANYPYATPAAQYPPHPPPIAPRHVYLTQYRPAVPLAHHCQADAPTPARHLTNGEVRPGGMCILCDKVLTSS